MTKCATRFACIGLIFSLLLSGCASGPQLKDPPPVPTDVAARLRTRLDALRAEKIEIPPEIKAGPPPVEFDCRPFGDPGFYMCKGKPGLKEGGGLYFAYDGPAQDLMKKLASERVLRELLQVIRSRVEMRDLTLAAVLDALETSLAMAEEYRAIAVFRGDEIERLRQEKLIDRITMMIPIIGLAAGIFMLGLR